METLDYCMDNVTDKKSCHFAATLAGCMIAEFKKLNPM